MNVRVNRRAVSQLFYEEYAFPEGAQPHHFNVKYAVLTESKQDLLE